jgi:hydrogenase maturation protease
MKAQVIGCGNLHRMDDGAGVLVAERLRALGIPAEVETGGAFELMAARDHHEHVILIDAVLTGAPVGTVHLWEGCPPYLPPTRQFSSHGFGLAEALRLGQALKCMPDRITVYGIEGKEFALGEAISPEVAVAIERVAQGIAKAFHMESLTPATVA